MKKELQDLSHKRYNILTGEWVLVSPHRSKRPWLGYEEEIQKEEVTTYDPDCYLCPGNKRANNKQNPNYTSTFVFENDYPALQKDTNSFSYHQGLLKADSEQGICKVVCFSPDHSKSLANMSPFEIEHIIVVWQQEFESLSIRREIKHVQIFENKGAIMGCSNPHPHGQIWAQTSIPNEVVKKTRQQREYFKENESSLLSTYWEQEKLLDERTIYENEHFMILVPFWAIWPFETMIIPKQHQQTILEMTASQNKAFAEAISVITKVYDMVFKCSFPYSSGIHQAPTDGETHTYWHWHMSFYPPLLRSATVKKFMVGYEMFGMPQRDITPEKATTILQQYL